MTCSKCLLPTAESDLTPNHFGNPVCGPCFSAESRPLTFSELADVSRRAYEYKHGVDATQPVNPEPMAADSVVAAAFDANRPDEWGFEDDGPVVSPQGNYRPGRTLYEVAYSHGGHGCRSGVTNVDSVRKAEDLVRRLAREGATIIKVGEFREQLPEEYGGQTEVLMIGEWSRERIQSVIGLYPVSKSRKQFLKFNFKTRIVTDEQLREGWVKLVDDVTTVNPYQIVQKVGENWEVVDPDPVQEITYHDATVKVKDVVVTKARAAYGVREDVILTGVTTLKAEEANADVKRILKEAEQYFKAGEEAAKKTLRSSASNPNFSNISKSVEESDDWRASMRRVKLFAVDRNRVYQFLTRGCRYVTNDLPADAEVVEVHEDPYRRQFLFTIQHPSFPVVGDGDVPPVVNPCWIAVEEPLTLERLEDRT